MTNPFDHSAIDEAIHGRLRLGVMAYLSSVSSASFLEIKAIVQATDGNLSVHLSKLEDVGYVSVTKSFSGKKTLTNVALTQLGRERWLVYLDKLQGLVNASGN